MLTIDARCGCSYCKERTQDIYRMVGSCSNCGTTDILVLYRSGDPKGDQDCPVCGVYSAVSRIHQRLATPDEIPTVAVPGRDELQERADAMYKGDRAEEINCGYVEGPPEP